MTSLTAALALILALSVVQTATAQDRPPRFDPAGCAASFCTESGWIADDNDSNHTITWRHRLRVTPRMVSVLFTPDPASGSAYQVDWSMGPTTSGNPVSIEVSNRWVRLHISGNLPLHGVWSPETDWVLHGEGYWKITAYR